MRAFYLLFTAIVFLTNCKKEDITKKNCYQEMKERFKNELKCTKQDEMEVNLYSGLYNEKRVYFTMTMCPSCNTLSPQEGYTCDGEKINITNFNSAVSDIKEVYNSCTQKFAN